MSVSFQRVTMVGLGYIGLPTAAVLANCGVEVIGVDINQEAVDTINRGEIHIVEPDLDGLVHHVVSKGLLRATTTPESADAFIIAVPTPFKGDHEPDLCYVEAASRSIAPVLKKGDLVILESTSPVGATEQVAKWLAEARPDLVIEVNNGASADINIAYCPERVLPGKVLTELVSNDRVVGGLTRKCAERAATLYRQFVKGECIITDARTAEMCKLTENSFRDVNIAFANELSIICDSLNINVWELIRLANRHPRVNILQPGPGVGGHCIAVDPWFIVSQAPNEAKLIRKAREVNDYKPHYVLNKIIDATKGINKPVIACLGLAFKANIDDLRESPSLDIVQHLAGKNAGKVLAVEPHISSLPSSLAGLGVELVSLNDALAVANVVVLLVDHAEFNGITAKDVGAAVLIDTRGRLR